MTFADLTSPDAILQAAQEFDELGRDAFLEKYGFGKARSYFLELDGRLYDSKAIVGAAHGYQFPSVGPLGPQEGVRGGEASAVRKLESLGFTVRVLEPTNGASEPNALASERLTLGAVYSREQLALILRSTDSTINTGVFRPKGFNSVCLFVTAQKTDDRTPYRDHLDGDTLHWQGQTEGRTDRLVIDHQRLGLEILLFHRESKRQYPQGGFVFEGCFAYRSHQGSRPTDFILVRSGAAPNHLDKAAEAFDPSSVEDGRRKTMRAVRSRQGQGAFRDQLMSAYGGRCAISGCSVASVLEAAHIHPYLGPSTNHVTNGLLLRADLHTLFDLGLITVGEDGRVIVAEALLDTEYGSFDGVTLRKPEIGKAVPSPAALAWHRGEHPGQVSGRLGRT